MLQVMVMDEVKVRVRARHDFRLGDRNKAWLPRLFGRVVSSRTACTSQSRILKR